MVLWKGEEVWAAGARTISFPFALLIHSRLFTPTPVAEAERGHRMWDPGWMQDHVGVPVQDTAG